MRIWYILYYTHICMCVCSCACVCVRSYVRLCMHVCTRVCVSIYVRECVSRWVCSCTKVYIYIRYVPKNPLLLFNGTERVVPFPFNNISLSVHDPFLICSRSVRIFCQFWIHFNFFPCCAICFRTGQSYVCFCFGSFRLSRSTALQVMASTLDHAELIDYKRAGMRRYMHLKSMMDTRVVRA